MARIRRGIDPVLQIMQYHSFLRKERRVCFRASVLRE